MFMGIESLKEANIKGQIYFIVLYTTQGNKIFFELTITKNLIDLRFIYHNKKISYHRKTTYTGIFFK